MWEILDLIAKLLQKLFIPIVAALLLLIFYRFIWPLLLNSFTDAALITGGWILLAVIAIIIILIWVLDKGSTSGGGCGLKTYRIWPDKCINNSCPKPCLVTTGPYPKWMGAYTFATQDITCVCGPTLISGLPPHLQALLNQVLSEKDHAALQKLIENAMMKKGLVDSSALDRLLELFQKFQREGSLTPEEIDELKKIMEPDK